MMLSVQDYKPNGGGIGGNKLLGALTGISTSRSGGYDRVYKGMYFFIFLRTGIW